MAPRRTFRKSLWLVVLVGGCGVLFGCSKPAAPTAIAEQPPAPVANPEAPQPPPAGLVEPVTAKAEDIQEVVKRLFKRAVVVESNLNPSFLVGDFNGDLSQDLAVILRIAEGKLSELNQEFPNWIAREPLKDVLLPQSKVMAQRVGSTPSTDPGSGQTIRFEQNDVLMAIVHGFGPNGWRDPEATQTHLLRDVVGTNIRTLPFNGAVKAYKGIKPFPTIYGDLIQQTLIGQSGFLYFNGGIYAWYDPKNYRAPAMPAHSGMSAMR
jgi:hypothetical protein